MKKKWFKPAAVVTTLALILVTAGCGATGTTPSTSSSTQTGTQNKVTLKFANGQPIATLANQTSVAFAKLVKDKTNGSVDITVYPNNQLGNESDLSNGLKSNTIDMAYISAGVVENLEPLVGVMNLPYVFRDYDHVHKVLDGAIGKQISDALEKNQKIKTLGYFDQGFRFITNNTKPINSLDDLKGMKIRVPNAPMFIRTLQLLGANPTPMEWGEVYTALQTHVVDGQENFSESVVTNKIYEVQKYLSKTYHIYAGSLIMISDQSWNKLSTEQQKAVQDAYNETFSKVRPQVATSDGTNFKTLTDKGEKVNDIADLTPFRKAVEPIYAEWGKKVGNTNLVQQVIDTK